MVFIKYEQYTPFTIDNKALEMGLLVYTHVPLMPS